MNSSISNFHHVANKMEKNCYIEPVFKVLSCMNVKFFLTEKMMDMEISGGTSGHISN